MDKEYYVKLHGRKIPVSKEVYNAYKRPEWRERKREVKRGKREKSLEAYTEAGGVIPSRDALIEEIVEDKLTLETLMAALEMLTEDERSLIEALYFQEKSERAYAEESEKPRMTIVYHRDQILGKLKKILENE